jgi:hypothetical protein
VALVTTAGFSWLFVLPIQVRGHTSNPYIGIIVFIVIPAVLVLGLVLIALGIYLARRRLAGLEQGLMAAPDRRVYLRRLAIFFAVTTAVNIVIGTQGTYRAVQYMDTPQFCGQTCHVMQPYFAAHSNSAHASVECAECHVSPGATGYMKAKMGGTRQFVDMVLDREHLPIESAVASNRLVPSRLTANGATGANSLRPSSFRYFSTSRTTRPIHRRRPL